MTENRRTVSASLEAFQRGAEARWTGGDLIAEPVEVRGKRILIADDEETIRAWLRMVLELEGHQITEASNGAEALKLFKGGEFDLVITDFEMPVMQGNTLAIGIKLLNPSLPILMITGSGSARRDGRNPVDALLSKPFTTADLHGALERLLLTRPELPQGDGVRTLESSSEMFEAKEQMVAHLPA
jgi:two-component system, cell cycle response regulator CpdR